MLLPVLVVAFGCVFNIRVRVCVRAVSGSESSLVLVFVFMLAFESVFVFVSSVTLLHPRLTTRHLGGAHQDNRTVPYEGLPLTALRPEQKEAIYDLIEEFNIYLPDIPRSHHMRRVRAYEEQTYFAWIGKCGLEDPYYFRIHSPVVFCEVSWRPLNYIIPTGYCC